MRRLALVATAVGAVVLLTVPAASAKDFAPGDLRLCDAAHCVKVMDRPLLKQLSRFYYSAGSPPTSASVALGAPSLELRFDNGYVTGIVATSRLDRFLSYGVHLERFARDQWYRVPAPTARALRQLASALTPIRITMASLARSR